MDSPNAQPLYHLHQLPKERTVYSSVDSKGAIRKRSASRYRSISTSQAERLYQLAFLEQSKQAEASPLPPTTVGPQWNTPQHSPQPQLFSEPLPEPFPLWTVPTPPRSDSGVPSVSIETNEIPVTTEISAPQHFDFQQPTASAEMRYGIAELLLQTP